MEKPVLIVCNSRADGEAVRSALKIFGSVNMFLNEQHFAYPKKSGVTVGVWSKDYPMVVPDDFPETLFIQGDQTAKQLIDQITAYYQPRNQQRREAFKRLRSLFPDFVYEEFDNPMRFGVRVCWVRYDTPIGKSPLDLDNIDNAYDELFRAWLIDNILMSLKKRWPFLYLYGLDAWWKDESGSDLRISTKNSNYADRHYEGASTGVRLKYPFTDEGVAEMKRLNSEAEKAMSKEFFFCTQCHTARPREEYGGYYFHEVRCKKCATPEWLKAARAETYD